VELACTVAGAKAIDYPAKLPLCCTGCAGPYNLTLWSNDTMSRALSCLLSHATWLPQ
jgi:hypothetical protein